MSLGLSLNNALTGLRASQSAFGVLSNNIANANNPDHSRQIISQSAVVVEGVGSGVRIDEITRNIDSFLRRSILNQGAVAQSTDTVNEFHERIQILLGNPGSENSLDESITSFYNTLNLLSETPERSSFRSNAVNGAVELSRQISDLAFRLEDLRFEADRQIDQAVDISNGILRELQQLNVTMASATVQGQSRAGLEDQRDALLVDLSEQMDITVFFEDTGAVNVFTANGVTILDNNVREISYNSVPSAEIFAQSGSIAPLQVISFNTAGIQVGDPVDLISSGTRGDITSLLNAGDIHGLQQVRDVIIPEFLDQLDTLSATLRDTVNTVHNLGTSFPPPATLEGTRQVTAGDQFNYAGAIRIAALQPNGEPVVAGYDNELDGFRPLTLDLSTLDSGQGGGFPTLQTIINEINNHFRAPPAKVQVGNVNNIQIASLQDRLPASPVAQFEFDFDIENLTGDSSSMYVTNFTVLDDTATDITAVTQDVPRLALDSVNTYTTAAGTSDVIVRTVLPDQVAVGDTIFLSTPPPGLINGIPNTELGGYFTVEAVSGNDVTISVSTLATPGGPVSVAGQTLTRPYTTVNPEQHGRTQTDGSVIVDLTANVVSQYYDISVDIGILEDDGTLSTTTITYRVENNEGNLRNRRYDNTAVTGNAERVFPNTTQERLRAILVDENGLEIPRVNGIYNPDIPGFLHIIGNDNLDARISIEDLGSAQLGDLSSSPQQPGTNRSFSHYFELNNFFESNIPTNTGDTVAGSAFNLQLQQRLIDDPNLIATSRLERNAQPTDPDANPNLTYRLFGGNNENAQALFETNLNPTTFAASGGLPQIDLTFSGYAGELLGFIASQAVAADTENNAAQSLLSGFEERSLAASSVNLDEELANTVVYQSSFSAAARVISIVDELFNDLLQVL